MAQSRVPPRARRRRARRSGRAHRDLLRSDDEGTRTTKTVKRKVTGVSTRGLHLLNLPAGTDVRRMREQLARMERRLNQLSEQVEERRLMPPTLNPLDLVSRINRDVERSLLRARNGVRYVRGTHAPTLGATPKEVVWTRGKAELWRYRNGPIKYGPPVLIVHSLVSRSYILDLRPGNSLVEYLTAAGLDVYMLDWGVPDDLDADNDLERYVDFYLPRAVKAVRRESGSDEVTLMGYCLGGVLAALYAAAPRAGAGAQPDPDGDAGRLRPDGRDGRVPARGPAERRRAGRRHRQRTGGRPLQRLLHAGADDRDRPEGDAAGQPLERRVRRGLPGDGAVVARPRAVPRRDRSASWSRSSSARTS